jgi:hypothetical protein
MMTGIVSALLGCSGCLENLIFADLHRDAEKREIKQKIYMDYGISMPPLRAHGFGFFSAWDRGV